jgi:catechol 2,3-dioxygenase-like lactoylglutathione lyase family enzyme
VNLHFDSIFYYVRDLPAAIRFYSGVLGLSLASQDTIARYDLDGVLFELIPTEDESELPGTGNARLCLKVEDVERAASELRSKGVQVARVQTVHNGRLASFQDPDGNELVLWEYSSPGAA